MQTFERKLLPGRVVIDDAGITRHDLLSHTHLPWSAIRRYHLALEIAPVNNLFTQMIGVGDVLLLLDLARGLVGDRDYKLALALDGADGSHLELDSGFRHAAAGIADILTRLHATQLAAAGDAIELGPLALSAGSISSAGKTIAREDVESVELFDDTPISLRVMARGKAFPFAKAPTAEIPNVLVALAVAQRLGYRVRGLALLEALVIRRPPASR